ncbi:3-hydroxyacyl-ACP dehydratase FabZ [Blattabacterium cuenoti]|uniref:3-hydroxyacyl-ACP dehydratase FabZ n=1 Tax=Blattabacterium cuenoti TaxID=1653831 RepID=UPI00374C98D6
MKKQKTISKIISLKGVGLYTNEYVTMTLKPAPEHTGFIFIRKDIENHPCIQANLSYVINETNKGIILKNQNGYLVRTSEHVLAALTGMDLDNIIVELDNVEIPIMDGSSKYFVEAIEQAGMIEQNADRECYYIKNVVSYQDNKTGSVIFAFPSNKFEIMTIVDFDLSWVSVQNSVFKHINQFKNNIASSKSVCFLYDRPIKCDDTETSNKKQSFYNYNQEIANHFLLDLIGYLTLIGKKLIGKIIAYKPYHSINVKFANKLISEIKQQDNHNIKFNLTQKPICDIKNIMKILPHKPPFLLVDKILELKDNYVVGIKNVTINEPFFIGHFPNEPIMPGVLQVEAIAQVGGVLVLSKVKNPEIYSTYFLQIKQVKFKKKVIPGDILVIRVILKNPIKMGIVHMEGKGYVNCQLVVEAVVIAKLVKQIV